MPNNSRFHPLALPVLLALGAANFSYAQASAPDSAQVTTAAIAEPAAVPVADAAATPPSVEAVPAATVPPEPPITSAPPATPVSLDRKSVV